MYIFKMLWLVYSKGQLLLSSTDFLQNAFPRCSNKTKLTTVDKFSPQALYDKMAGSDPPPPMPECQEQQFDQV